MFLKQDFGTLIISCIVYKKHQDWLIDWLFTVLRPTQEFFTYIETSPLPVKGLKIWAYARRSGPLSREGSLSCHTYCDSIRDLGFSGPIRRTAPFSRLLRYTRGCGGSIPTWISTGKSTKMTNGQIFATKHLFFRTTERYMKDIIYKGKQTIKPMNKTKY
jgi:hypothetical protein